MNWISTKDRLPEQNEPEHCMCEACKDGIIHDSDCAVHNMPAMPNGECDCSVKDNATEE